MEHVHDWSLAWRLCEGMYWMLEAGRNGYFGSANSAGAFDLYAAQIAMRAQPEIDESLEPGWYFYWDEYPDEGSDGPYPTEAECRAFAACAAEDACDREDGAEPPPFTIWHLEGTPR